MPKLCVLHESKFVSKISKYVVWFGPYNSFIGHNALFCARRYAINIEDKKNGNVKKLTKPKNVMHVFFDKLIGSRQFQTRS